MAKYECNRCHELLNTMTEGTHLCADLKKRYERQREAVEFIKRTIYALPMQQGMCPDSAVEEAALVIVRHLSGRDLGVA